MADHVPKGIRPIENGARQVIEATIAGLGVGAMVGSIDAYLKSPVVIGGRRAPVLREVAGQLGRTSLLWGATWFTFVFTKQIVSGLRGSSVDATSSLLGGAAAGTVFGMSSTTPSLIFPFLPHHPSLRPHSLAFSLGFSARSPHF